MKTLKEMREAVGSLITRNDEIADHVSKGTATDEMRSEYNSNCEKIESLNADIKILEDTQRRQAIPVVTEVVDKEAEEIRKNITMNDFVRSAQTGIVEGFVKEMRDLGEQEASKAHIEARGIAIPMKAVDSLIAKTSFGKRDMTAGTNSAGGYAVPTIVNTFIDALWPLLYFSKFGVIPKTGLYGNQSFPVTSTINPSFATENGSANETQPTISQVTMTPRRLPGYIELSKTLSKNSQITDQWVLDEIIKGIINTLENQSIQGDGIAPNPTGILNTSGIGSAAVGANGGAPTYAIILELISEIAQSNANFKNAGFLTNPIMMTKLMGTQTFPSSSNGMPITQAIGGIDNLLTAGYKTAITSNVPSTLTKGTSTDCSAIIFGDFSELMVGQWGGLDMYIDPYTKMEQSLTRVYVDSFWDIAVKHAASFSACKDARNV